MGHLMSRVRPEALAGELCCDGSIGAGASSGACGARIAPSADRYTCSTCADFDLCVPCGESRRSAHSIGEAGGAAAVGAAAVGAAGGAAAALADPRPAVTAPRDDLPCVCEGTPADFDGNFVGCDGCGRWVHAVCAGFNSAEEAEAATSYLCLLCACKEGERAPRPTGATLLVCPAAIVGQWRQEAERHVHGNALRVCTYTGVRDGIHYGWKQPTRLAALHPARLQTFDLVLTTFETLRSELDHTPQQMGSAGGGSGEGGDRDAGGGGGAEGNSRSLRGAANRGHATSRVLSPLLSLHWWRLVIDEAQMVESGTAKAAAMALRIQAEHRWAVSGTPMGRGQLGDLQGLMAFLQLSPWKEAAWWNHAIELPLTLKDAADDDAPPPSSATGTSAAGTSAAGTSTTSPKVEPLDAAGTPKLARSGLGKAFKASRMQVRTRVEGESRLLALLHSIMWRNSKLSVLDQLDLPPQTEKLHLLTFSSIERHFYEKQARECTAFAQKALSLRALSLRASQPEDAIGGTSTGTSTGALKGARAGQTAAAAERALATLSLSGVLRLRQACCHPQLGSFGIKSKRSGAAGGQSLDNPVRSSVPRLGFAAALAMPPPKATC